MVMEQTERDPDIALSGDTDGGQLAANSDHDDTPNMTGMDELVRLMRRQTELTERLLAKAGEKADNVAEDFPQSSSVPPGDVSREILDVLRSMDERQKASGTQKICASIPPNL